jgi:hypothetical protein
MTTTTTAATAAHLAQRLALVERRVRQAVQLARRDDPDPDDPMRGLYLSPERVQRLLDLGASGAPPPPPAADGECAELLAGIEASADEAEATGIRFPLRTLAESFHLDAFALDVLLIALAPDLDPRFERLYGYLNDDVTRRRATIGLALALLGADPLSAALRYRFDEGSPLVGGGLLELEETASPFLARPLRVPDRVAAFVLGGTSPDPHLGTLLRPLTSQPGATGRAASPAAGLALALAGGVRLVYLRAESGSSPERIAAAALGKAGLAALALDLSTLSVPDPATTLVPTLIREARLCAAGLVVGPIDALDPVAHPEHARLLRSLAEASAVVVVFTGHRHWDPLWSDHLPLPLTAPGLDALERMDIWRAALAQPTKERPGGEEKDVSNPGVDPEWLGILAAQTLAPEQIQRAVTTARALAETEGGELTHTHLRSAVRAQNAAGLRRLARRIEPEVGWDDLVLPETVAGQLREFASRAAHRDLVLGTWSMRPGGGRGRGVTALFAGDSGTGKTMSAEAIAGELGLDLYVVDLSTVVDKFIGETEKNLERIFAEAAGAGGVLLFDEADAIFGKRSEVHDAHDRYANTESAYLLQRMESFDGIAVLTTNLRANLDEAFTRRLDAVIEFPLPDRAGRRALWDRCLGSAIPRGTALDLEACARFELTGGAIRSCAVTAAYRVAREGRAVSTADLIDAVREEYRKLGRLVLEHDFEP